MLKLPGSIWVTVFVWVVTGAAGVLFVWGAFQQATKPSRSKIGKAINDLRVVLGLLIGVVFVIWVIWGILYYFLSHSS